MTDSCEGLFRDGCQGAVSLTFDDGLPSQLRTALPMLDERGIKATFYLTPRDSVAKKGDWLERLAQWREAAGRGHEIGNHTVSHVCSRAIGGSPDGPCLENMTIEAVQADIIQAQQRLEQAIGLAPQSFAYPCYNDSVGEAAQRQSYVPVVARHFLAARGKGEAPNYPLTCDMHYLSSYPCEGMSGAEMVGLAVRSAVQGCWVVLTLHGVDEGHLPVTQHSFQELCSAVAHFRDSIWTAPVAVVAQRIIEWRNANRYIE